MFVRLSSWNEGDNAGRFATVFAAGFDVQLTHHRVHQTSRSARRDPPSDYAALQVTPGLMGFKQ